jgi:hypothetical protein
MSYRKRKESPVLSKAKLSVMVVIKNAQGAEVDYGKLNEPLTTVELEAAITTAIGLDRTYNNLLSEADDKLLEIEQHEATLNAMNVQILSTAANRFGRNSDEVDQLGGVRLKDRKHPVRKPKATK